MDGETAPAEAALGRWLYADKPLESGDLDALRYGAYADALALVMDQKDTSTPLTIAINGPWGSGKTSLARMAEARLPDGSDWDAPHVICKFDAWANDDAPHLGAAFAAAVAKALTRERGWLVRLAMPLPTAMLSPEQRWWRRLGLLVLTVVLAVAAIFWPTSHSMLAPLLHANSTVSALGHGTAATRLAWPALIVAVIAVAQKLGPGIQGVARWIDDPQSEAAHGSMQDANAQLARLIRQALRGKRRLMIFVDNLERCRPPRAVEVCEVVSQLIGHPEVVTVLIGDMDTIALSAEIKYAALESIPGLPRPGGLAGSPPAGAYGRAYLEKLIQIQLTLPPPMPTRLQEMLIPVAGEPPAFPVTQKAKRGPQPTAPATPPRSLDQLISGLRANPSGTLTGVAAAILALSAVTLGADLVPVGAAGAVAAAVAAVAAVGRSFERREERQKERQRDAVDEVVASKVVPTETTLGLQDEVAAELAGQDSGIDERDIRRRMRQHIVSNSELRAELDRAVLSMLPLSPRGAKRMFNHAHLLLDIGVERGIFAGQPGLETGRLEAGQLAAWVALTERWPSVAAAITRDPALMERLEEAARQTALALRPEELAALEAGLGVSGLDGTLLGYLCRVDSLSPVVRLLVNFSPAADVPARPAQARQARAREAHLHEALVQLAQAQQAQQTVAQQAQARVGPVAG